MINRPSDWDTEEDPPGPRDVFFRGEGQPPPVVSVIRTPAAAGLDWEQSMLVSLSTLRAQFPDLEVLAQERTEVPGAADATRLETRYVEEVDGKDVLIREVAVFARAGDRVVTVRAGSPEERYDEHAAILDQILDTVRLTTDTA